MATCGPSGQLARCRDMSAVGGELEVRNQEQTGAIDPERSLTPLEPPVSAPPDPRCCSRRTQPLHGPGKCRLGQAELSRDCRSHVRN